MCLQTDRERLRVRSDKSIIIIRYQENERNANSWKFPYFKIPGKQICDSCLGR